MNKPRMLLVDFSNLVYTCFFRSLLSSGLKPENVPANFKEYLFTFHERVNNLVQSHPGSSLLFALDQFPKWKKDIYPEYKATRKPLDFSPKPGCLELIRNWSCATLEGPEAEADDVIATFVEQNHHQYDITVVTTDKDLWQVKEHASVAVFNFHANTFIGQAELQKAFDLEKFSQIRIHKTLWGDSSDNIPNLIPRMQKNLLPLIKESDGTLDNFRDLIAQKRDSLSKRCLELWEENQDKLDVNYKLVSLRKDVPIQYKTFPG